MSEPRSESRDFIPHTDEQTVGPRLRCFCGAEHQTGACTWGDFEKEDPQPVCPYCVQWRCSRHHNDSCAEAECQAGGYEPYWANGQVAVLTQQEPCSECLVTLAAMQADREGPDSGSQGGDR